MTSRRTGRCAGPALRLAGLTVALICFLPSASAAAPAPSSEPAAVAHRLWDALLTHCGDSYFYAGSIFDAGGMLSDVQVGHQKTMEYRGVRFNLVPIRVSDAERANGFQYEGRMTMVAHLYRQQGEQWEDGLDARPRNTDDIFGRVLGEANSDMFDMGSSGAMALTLVKFKGEWAAIRSSVNSSGDFSFHAKYYDVEKVIAAKTPRYSCAAASVVQPSQVQPHAAAAPSTDRQDQPKKQVAPKLAKAAPPPALPTPPPPSPPKGVPFIPVSDDELGEQRKVYLGLNGPAMTQDLYRQAQEQSRPFWGRLQERLEAEDGDDDPGIAPGTTFTAECFQRWGNDCWLYRGKTKDLTHFLAIVRLTSGPHAGEHVLIDEAHGDPGKSVGQGGVGYYGVIK